VIALGDSHAIGYQSLFSGYVMSTGATVTVYTNAGCPFVSLHAESQECRAHSAAALDDMLGRMARDTVVFLPSLRMPRFVEQAERFDDVIVEAAIFSEVAARARRRAVTEAMPVMQRIRASGAKVVFEAPKPIFKSPPFRCANAYTATNPICTSGSAISREALMRLRQPVVDAMRTIEAAVPGVSIWDPFPELCPSGGSCHSYRAGRPLFFDGDHVSGYGGLLLVPGFVAHVRNVSGSSNAAVTTAKVK
jgi:hypothetical protein